MKENDSYIFFDKDTAFEGEVSTDHLVLEGVITGDVRASKDVFLKQGSIVQGEIATKKYLVEEGSVHQGKLRMNRYGSRPPESDIGNGSGKSTNGDGLKPAEDNGKVPSDDITISLPNGTSSKDAVSETDGSSKRLW